MSSVVSGHKRIRKQFRSFGLSTVPVLLTVAMPKCPLCWAALMSAVAAGPAISFRFLHPAAVVFLFMSVLASFLRARLRRAFGPFYLTIVAALLMYLSKFRLNYDPGVYVSAGILFIAVIWNALPVRDANAVECDCKPSPSTMPGV